MIPGKQMTWLRNEELVEMQPLRGSMVDAFACPYCASKVPRYYRSPEGARVPIKLAHALGAIKPVCIGCGGLWLTPDIYCDTCEHEVAPLHWEAHRRNCEGLHKERRAQAATANDVEVWLFGKGHDE